MQDQPRRELVVTTSLVLGGMVEISVADTGPGLADEVRAKLFQPFVTTKALGMGVGLSVCRATWNRTAAGSGRTIIPAEARISALPFDMWGLIVCTRGLPNQLAQTIDPYQCTASIRHLSR